MHEDGERPAGLPMTLAELGIAVDRDAEVPIGVQMAWAIRARIGDGTLTAGQPLPALRDLAQAAGVNINTVRTVYERLEQDGLVLRKHGSGTFVTPTTRGSWAIGAIAAKAAREALGSGVDPREVAAALYAGVDSARQHDAGAERRRLLRLQIAALETAANELAVEQPNEQPPAAALPADGPRLLGIADLEDTRRHLLRRLAALQAASDGRLTGASEESPTSRKASRSEVPAGARPGPRSRPRPRTA
jgi:DNA-binding transcriptional regulator YhcF (GntR family)